MKFGMQFFPDVRESEKSPVAYYSEAMRLVSLCDEYRYSHVRTVEHYFHHWGGNSPNPIMFLTAAAQHTKNARLVTGAVLPAFNHPLKLASDLAMLDGISGGKLDIGFARAFLPQEFRHFEVDMDESVERFEEGIQQVEMLLEDENVSSEGKFHSFSDVTTYPRPTQKPRPNFYIAAVGTPSSFERAGKMGHGIMAIPGVGSDPISLLNIYRTAWKKAAHKGKPKIMMAVFMFCHEDREEAIKIAKPRVEGHFASIVDAMSEYRGKSPSKGYKDYDKMRDKVAQQTFEGQLKAHAAFVGTPKDIIMQLEAFNESAGGVDEVSMQVNFGNLPITLAESSVRLFGKRVIPHFL